jgi:hypothetical protein
VFTTKADVHQHEALREIGGKIREGFEVNHRSFELPADFIDRLRAREFVKLLRHDEDGNPTQEPLELLEFYAQAVVKHNNQHIELGFELCAPESIPHMRKL